MKRLILLILMMTVCLAGVLRAQVDVTERFISLNGVKYYLHTIKKGQTLEAIAEAYHSDVQSIKINNQNKEFVEGVLIKVPVLSNNSIPASNQEFVYHKVEKKQTLYSICKQYEVSEEDVYKYNPNAKFGIKSGEVLKIPVGKVSDPDHQSLEFIYHTVKQNESLNSICATYKVDINDLIKYNPKAKTDFKPGMILTLPKTSDYINRNNSNSDSEPKQIEQSDLVKIEAAKNNDYCPCDKFNYNRSKTFRIGLMLPLYLQQNAELISQYKTDPNKNSLANKNSDKIFEFYEGVLLAAREYQMRGYNIQLDVLDTENSFQKTNEICSNPDFKNVDLIIGPLYTENVGRVARFAKDNCIAMVSPFAVKNELLKDNPYLFQFTPCNQTSIEETAEYFSSLENGNIILLYNNESKNIPAEMSLIKSYREIIGKISNISLKEVNFDNGETTILKSAMNFAETNIILMASTKEVFISKIINYLNGLQKNENYKIVLFGNQNWERIGNIDVEFLQSMGFCYRSTSFINYQRDEVKNFVTDFREKFNAEPGIYGFSGYDIANYFIGQLSKKGKYFHFCPDNATQGLIYKFDFQKVAPLGGYENRSNYVLRYAEDFTLQDAE